MMQCFIGVTYTHGVFNILKPEQKRAYKFQMHFLQSKSVYLIQISVKFLSDGLNGHHIDSDNDLAPNRWHAIIWINYDIFY